MNEQELALAIQVDRLAQSCAGRSEHHASKAEQSNGDTDGFMLGWHVGRAEAYRGVAKKLAGTTPRVGCTNNSPTPRTEAETISITNDYGIAEKFVMAAVSRDFERELLASELRVEEAEGLIYRCANEIGDPVLVSILKRFLAQP